MARQATDLMAQYAAYHRDRRNIATHFVGIPLIVIAGQDYGAGSSRDWPPKARVCSMCGPSLPADSSGFIGPI